MSNYRPIQDYIYLPQMPLLDTWSLVRGKFRDGNPYYGAYPAGFLERARALLGVQIDWPVLHVCGGRSRDYIYPTRAFGPNDRTLDLNPELEPDYLQDARDPLPPCPPEGWPAILADPPYSEADAEHYEYARAERYPAPCKLLRNCLDAVRPGGRVGFLHYVAPSPPTVKQCGYEVKLVALASVFVGYNNRIRLLSVYERVRPRT